MYLSKENIFTKLLDDSPCYIWIYNSEGLFEYANQKLLDFAGKTTLFAHSIYDVFSRKINNRNHDNSIPAIANKSTDDHIEDVMDSSGKKFRFLIQQFLIEHSSKKLIACYAYDVTLYSKLKDKVEFDSNILNNIKQAVIGSDVSGKIFLWNKQATQLYGWSKEEALGKSIDIMANTGIADQVHASEIVDNLSQGKSWSGELKLKKKSGKSFPAYVTDTPIYDKKGNLKAIIGISHDISEKVKAEKKIKLALKKLSLQNKALKKIAFCQSHEVRSPLTNIMGIIPLLCSHITSQEGKSLLQLLKQSSADLDSIIKYTVNLSHKVRCKPNFLN